MGIYRVYYMKPDFFRDGISGTHPEPAGLSKTHQMVAVVHARSLEHVFHYMQGEIWSPHGEARPLIEALGLCHTSMSVGDCIVDEDGVVYLCRNMGFTELGRVRVPARQGA